MQWRLNETLTARPRVEAATTVGVAKLWELPKCQVPQLAFSVEQTGPGARKLKRVERAYELPGQSLYAV